MAFISFDGGFVLTECTRPVVRSNAPHAGVGVYVINLDHRSNRMHAILSLVTQLSWPMYRVSAVNGNLLLGSDLQCVDQDYCAQRLRRPLTLGAIGCSLSHIKVWQDFLKSSHAYALVMEDDVQFSPDQLNTIVSELIETPMLWDVARFTYKNDTTLFSLRPLSFDRVLALFSAHSSDTGCYIVNRIAAEKLLSKALPIKLSIDHYMFRSWEFGLKVTAVAPSVIYQDGLVSDTADSLHSSEDRTFYKWIYCKISRWVFSLKKRVMTFGHALCIYYFR